MKPVDLAALRADLKKLRDRHWTECECDLEGGECKSVSWRVGNAADALLTELEQLRTANSDVVHSHNGLLIDGARWQKRAEDAEAELEQLRKIQASVEDHHLRIERLDAIRIKWDVFMRSTPWMMAALRYARAYTAFNADRQPEDDPADVIRWLLNQADLYQSEKNRATEAEAELEQLRAQVKAQASDWRVVPNPMRDDGVFICDGPDRTYPDGSPQLPQAVIPSQMYRGQAEAIVKAHNIAVGALLTELEQLRKQVAKR